MPKENNKRGMLLRLKLRRMTRLHVVKYFLIFCIFTSLLELIHLRRRFRSSLDSSLIPLFRQERVFIASTHWNNEAVIRSHWNSAVVDLIREIGVDHVHVSIYESGSWDDSKGALRELGIVLDELGVSKTLILDQTTHIDEIEKPPAPSGWIDTSRGKKELRRIPYLSKLRNLSLQPLYDLEASGRSFDKILFLNDIVFETDDFRRLLNTNGGSYSAACALDFAKPPRYYDTFALRDSDGEEAVMQTWPYFRSRASRQAMLKNQPVPVSSCWNGMVLMDAAPFYNITSPLKFRGIPDSLATTHVEGSECCLIHADNPLSSTKGVYLNPDVHVGYSGPAYEAVHRHQSWLTMREYVSGLWENRLRRWTTTTWFKKRIVINRLHAWQREMSTHYEPGEHCLINEMQVLISNGWAHV